MSDEISYEAAMRGLRYVTTNSELHAALEETIRDAGLEHPVVKWCCQLGRKPDPDDAATREFLERVEKAIEAGAKGREILNHIGRQVSS